jgi:8-oxo-dGTP pyrophosphatase MutT (NUDIX family)
MLVRDAPAFEVFMLRRNVRSVFVGGAHVFPGGAVDPDDRDDAIFDLAAGIDDATASRALGVSDGALGFWVAAIRESFEEAGVLIARDATTDTEMLVDVSQLDVDRRALTAGERRFVDIVRDRDLVLDAGALHPFAHWITPPGAPRRYDTWFFVAPAPEGHAYEHDDDETVASVWIRPADALEQARRREIELIYPTFRSLQSLARFETAADLLRTVRNVWHDDARPMQVENPGQGWVLRLPGDADGSDLLGDEADAVAHSTTTRGRARGTTRAG